MGRPTKYDPERVEIICQCLKDGCTRKASYESVGISQVTFLAWLRQYPDFLNNVFMAEAEAENLMVAAVCRSAIGGDWRAAESWLKRRRRDDWGDNEKVTHGGSLEFIAAGAAEADAKFAASVARSRANPLLAEPDPTGEN